LAGADQGCRPERYRLSGTIDRVGVRSHQGRLGSRPQSWPTPRLASPTAPAAGAPGPPQHR
jgi:hypothetical protein